MLASDLEYSVAVGDDEEQSQTDTPSLNFVWGVFKESGTSAKLILPDLLSNPFYLPSPRATKADKDAKFEREMRRFDFLCARDSKFVAPSDRRSILNLLPNYDLRGRERSIEKKLVDPYRNDPALRAELLREVMEREASQGSPQKEVKRAVKPVAPKPPSMPREARQSMVQQRHTMLLNAEQESLAQYSRKMEEKRQRVQESLEQLAIQQASTRQTQWIQIITALGALRVIHTHVSATRQTKALDPVSWKACIKIQKWFRKIVFFKLKRNIKGCRPPAKVNNIVKMLRDAAMENGGERRLYSLRQRACTVITTFLRELQGRMIVYARKFLSKIKHLQFYLKRHYLYNALRLALIQRLIEVCLPVLLTHMEVVAQGRGHDLKNLTSYDLNKLSSVDRLTARTALVHKMNTASFHSYLRSQLSQIPVVLSVFKSVGGRVSRNVEYIRDELFDLLQKKRRLHIIQLAAAKIEQLKIPAWDVDHIKEFIHGGEDPLHSFLVQAQREQDERHDARMAARRTKAGRAVDGRNALLLLRSVDTEDLTFVIMSAAVRLGNTRGQRFRGNINSSGSAAGLSTSALPGVALGSRAGDSDAGTEDAGVSTSRVTQSGETVGAGWSGARDSFSGGGHRLSRNSGTSRAGISAGGIRGTTEAGGSANGRSNTGRNSAQSEKENSVRPATPPKATARSKLESPQKSRRMSALRGGTTAYKA